MRKLLIGLIAALSITFAGCSPTNTTQSTVTESVTQIQTENTVIPATPEVTESIEKTEYTVYITRTGSKYHSAGCRYLRQSSIPIDKDDAIGRGYDACSKCNP